MRLETLFDWKAVVRHLEKGEPLEFHRNLDPRFEYRNEIRWTGDHEFLRIYLTDEELKDLIFKAIRCTPEVPSIKAIRLVQA